MTSKYYSPWFTGSFFALGGDQRERARAKNAKIQQERKNHEASTDGLSTAQRKARFVNHNIDGEKQRSNMVFRDAEIMRQKQKEAEMKRQEQGASK